MELRNCHAPETTKGDDRHDAKNTLVSTCDEDTAAAVETEEAPAEAKYDATNIQYIIRMASNRNVKIG